MSEGRSVESEFPQLGSPPNFPASALTHPRSNNAAVRIVQQTKARSAPSPYAKVTLVRQGQGRPEAVSESAEDEEEEKLYAAPEAPRTLADCLSNFSLGDSPSSQSSSTKKAKKKGEARLLFSSGRRLV